MKLLNSIFMWILFVALTIAVNGGTKEAIGASAKKSLNSSGTNDVSAKENQSSKLDEKDFKDVLANMTKKTLSDFIAKKPHNPYVVFAKTNLTAIDEAGDGFGKLFIVLKNKTRINVQQVTTEYKNHLQFSDQIIRIDPSTISYIELHSGTEELEPYIEYKWGKDLKYYLNGPSGIFGEVAKGNSLLPSTRTNGIIKYKLKTSLETLHPAGETLDKFDILDILKRSKYKFNLNEYRTLTEEEQKTIVATMIDMTFFRNDFGNKKRYFAMSTDEMLTYMKTSVSDKSTTEIKILDYLLTYSLIAENNMLVLPSTHGKNDYYPFITFY